MLDRIRIVTGNITNMPDVDAIVNAANDRLRGGQGVCGAIFKAAGWEAMQNSCNTYPPDSNGIRCPTGDAKATPAHDLPNKVVIHAVGPIYNPSPLWASQNADELASAYLSSIEVADTLMLDSVAFPAISCGIYGYPMPEGAEVALKAVLKGIQRCPSIKEVRFVFLPFGDGPELQAIFEQVLQEMRDGA